MRQRKKEKRDRDLVSATDERGPTPRFLSLLSLSPELRFEAQNSYDSKGNQTSAHLSLEEYPSLYSLP
jgi:hypothetical protein